LKEVFIGNQQTYMAAKIKLLKQYYNVYKTGTIQTASWVLLNLFISKTFL